MALPSGRTPFLLKMTDAFLSGEIFNTRLSKIELTKRFPSRSKDGPSRKIFGSASTSSQGSAVISGRPASAGGKGTSLRFLIMASFRSKDELHATDFEKCCQFLNLSYVSLCNVPAHHSVGVEIISILAYRVLHHGDPFLPVTVVCWNDDRFELAVEIFCVYPIRFFISYRSLWFRTDGPARVSFDVSFNPPSVKNTEIQDSIVCCLHAACSGG